MDVILSIKPKYCEDIKKGKKKYEFRKRISKSWNQAEKVFMYSTSPVKKIVGTFTVDTIIEDIPDKLWKNFESSSGLCEKEFFEYFGTSKKGYAIRIKNVLMFNPVDPKVFIPSFVPPQSYCYVNRHEMRNLEKIVFQPDMGPQESLEMEQAKTARYSG